VAQTEVLVCSRLLTNRYANSNYLPSAGRKHFVNRLY